MAININKSEQKESPFLKLAAPIATIGAALLSKSGSKEAASSAVGAAAQTAEAVQAPVEEGADFQEARFFPSYNLPAEQSEPPVLGKLALQRIYKTNFGRMA